MNGCSDRKRRVRVRSALPPSGGSCRRLKGGGRTLTPALSQREREQNHSPILPPTEIGMEH